MNWKQKFTSRKFWMAVVGAFLVIANEGLGFNIPENVVVPFAALIIAYILGESLVDANRK
jgi:uncharacterized membrane protein